MEVEGITIVIGEVDKYINAIQAADNSQALIKKFIDYLVKCQRKLSRGKDGANETLSQELDYAARKIVLKIANEGPNSQLILALTEVVTYFSVLSISWLLGLIKSLGRIEDQNAQHTAIVLVLVATTKSGKISELAKSAKDKSALKQINTIATFFANIAREKVLEDIAFEGLVLLLEQLQANSTLFKEQVLPAVSPLLEAKHWSFNTVLFALQAIEHFKDLDLSTAGISNIKDKTIASPAHLTLFANIFAHHIPNLDSQFWALILRNVQNLSTDDKIVFVGGIWKTIAGILSSKKKDIKLLGLFNLLWELDEALHQSLLIDSLFTVLRRHMHETAQSQDSEVSSVIQKLKEASLQDQAVSTTVLCGCPELATSLPQKKVTEIIASLALQFGDNSQNSLRIAVALSQIARDSQNAGVTMEVMKFLFFHGFFGSKSGVASSKKSKVPPLPVVLGAPLRAQAEAGDSSATSLSAATRNQVQQQFFKVLVHSTTALISAKTSSKHKDKEGDANGQAGLPTSSTYSAIVHFHRQLLTFSNQIELRKPLEEDCNETLSSAATLVEKIKTQLSDTASSKYKELDGFLLLLCLSYIILLADPLEPADNVADLLQCYQDIFQESTTATKNKKRKTAQDAPQTDKNKAIAVLVDVIISLQAKPLYLVAALPEHVIRSFAKELTSQSIEGIIKAITEYSLNKLDAEDEDDDDEEDPLAGDESEPGSDENDEVEVNGNEQDASDSGSDIMIDDLDDDTLKELDDVIAKIMKKERKPKLKPPTGSSKDPDIEFRERAASLLFSYAKKANTVVLLELLPALLTAIDKLQRQKTLTAKQAEEGTKSNPSESQKRRHITQFYKSVTARVADIFKEICHTRSALVQQLSPAQREALYSQLITYCTSDKSLEISKLAVDALFLVNRSTEQLAKLLKNPPANVVKPVIKYIVHTVCTRYPSLVWNDSALLALFIERDPNQVLSLVGSLDIENLKIVGSSLELLLNTQIKDGSKLTVLPTLRTVIQKLVSSTSRDVVKASFPELVFTLNKLIQDASRGEAVHKIAKQITTAGFVGSQKQFKKSNKAKLKQEKAKEKEAKEDSDAEESEEEQQPTTVKGGLYFTKSKAYRKSRLRKRKGEEADEGKRPRGNKQLKKKDNSKWFLNKS